jgi:hypothetical protein
MMSGMSTEMTSGGSHQQPGDAGAAEHDAAELVERLRSTPAAEIMTDLFSTLLSTAQVKLGRRDARLFIDLCSLTLEYAGQHLPEELGSQVTQALGELRLAQVNAENMVAKKGEPQVNDLSRVPTPPTSEVHPGVAASTPQPASPPTSKLWIPGR